MPTEVSAKLRQTLLEYIMNMDDPRHVMTLKFLGTDITQVRNYIDEKPIVIYLDDIAYSFGQLDENWVYSEQGMVQATHICRYNNGITDVIKGLDLSYKQTDVRFLYYGNSELNIGLSKLFNTKKNYYRTVLPMRGTLDDATIDELMTPTTKIPAIPVVTKKIRQDLAWIRTAPLLSENTDVLTNNVFNFTPPPVNKEWAKFSTVMLIPMDALSFLKVLNTSRVTKFRWNKTKKSVASTTLHYMRNHNNFIDALLKIWALDNVYDVKLILMDNLLSDALCGKLYIPGDLTINIPSSIEFLMPAIAGILDTIRERNPWAVIDDLTTSIDGTTIRPFTRPTITEQTTQASLLLTVLDNAFRHKMLIPDALYMLIERMHGVSKWDGCTMTFDKSATATPTFYLLAALLIAIFNVEL